MDRGQSYATSSVKNKIKTNPLNFTLNVRFNENTFIEQVEEHKLLGIHIDHNLEWNKHTQELHKKCQTRSIRRTQTPPRL